MKNIANLLRKLNNPLAYSSVMCAAGVAFIALPSGVLDIVILALGAIICLARVSLIAASALAPYDDDEIPLMRHASVLKASLMLLFGISLMLVRSSVSRPVCITLGVLLALYSLFRLSRPSRSTPERGAGWYIEGIILIALALLGALVAVFPLYPTITAGVAMLAFGAKLTYDALEEKVKRRRATRSAKKADRKRPGDVYSTDFTDKSDDPG